MTAGVTEERRGECWWLVLEDGTALAGDQGGSVALLSRLRATRFLGICLGTLRLSGALDAVDRVVARARGHLGAVVPEGPAPRRFP